MGYSLYDTMIVFDRIRETCRACRARRSRRSQPLDVRGVHAVPGHELRGAVPVGALLLFGGETLKDFAFALLVGVLSGAYSSIFIATPVLVEWKEREHVYMRRRRLMLEQFGGQVPAFAPGVLGEPGPRGGRGSRGNAERAGARRPPPRGRTGTRGEQPCRRRQASRRATATPRPSHELDRPAATRRQPAEAGAPPPRRRRRRWRPPPGDGAPPPSPPPERRPSPRRRRPPAPAARGPSARRRSPSRSRSGSGAESTGGASDGMVVWVMMGIAVWHFTVFLPDRFWGGIVGAFLAAVSSRGVFGFIVNGGSVPGPERHPHHPGADRHPRRGDRPGGLLLLGRPHRPPARHRPRPHARGRALAASHSVAARAFEDPSDADVSGRHGGSRDPYDVGGRARARAGAWGIAGVGRSWLGADSARSMRRAASSPPRSARPDHAAGRARRL